MRPGICACCEKGGDCTFRQPGTWVVQCEDFEERPVPVPTGLVPEEYAELEGQRADQPTV